MLGIEIECGDCRRARGDGTHAADAGRPRQRQHSSCAHAGAGPRLPGAAGWRPGAVLPGACGRCCVPAPGVSRFPGGRGCRCPWMLPLFAPAATTSLQQREAWLQFTTPTSSTALIPANHMMQFRAQAASAPMLNRRQICYLSSSGSHSGGATVRLLSAPLTSTTTRRWHRPT